MPAPPAPCVPQHRKGDRLTWIAVRKFLQLAHDAIKQEEEELKQLKADQHSNFGSTRQCDEAWQKYFILKHAIRLSGFRPKLFSELPCGKKHIDLYFVDGSGATLAVFESLSRGTRIQPLQSALLTIAKNCVISPIFILKRKNMSLG